MEKIFSSAAGAPAEPISETASRGTGAGAPAEPESETASRGTGAGAGAGGSLSPRERRYREAALTAVQALLVLAGLLAVMMLMSESEDLSLGRFIAQKAGGLALLGAARFGFIKFRKKSYDC